MIAAAIIDRAASVRLEDELSRRGIKLNGKNGSLSGPCPICGGNDRFAVSLKKQLFNCRGCGAKGGDTIALVQVLDGKGFRDAVEALGGGEPAHHVDPASAASLRLARPDRSDDGNRQRASDIWRAAVDPRDTLAHIYLEHRGLDLPDEVAGEAIRFHPACPMGEEHHPAMICLVRNILTDRPQAIHRTALSPAGTAIKHNGKTFRMSLGPVSGGAIKIDRHSSVSNVLAIGEGVETCLAGRHYGYSPAWAMISDKGIESFPLVPGVERLLIFGDDDDAGKRASTACKDRWIEAGRRVGIVWPAAGNDLNDELLASSASEPRAELKDTAGGCGALEFLTAVQGFWPGAAIVTAEENIEREQFRKELAGLRAATQSHRGGRSRGGPPCRA